ncbi:MAG: SOS response-associated peptidase family protein [Caldilineaceae bacterium]
MRITRCASSNPLRTARDAGGGAAVQHRFHQPVAVVRFNRDTAEREWALTARAWVPSWSKDPTIGSRMINARRDRWVEKLSFRRFRRRRCSDPGRRLYEWQKRGSRKQLLSPCRTTLSAFAGLWEYWRWTARRWRRAPSSPPSFQRVDGPAHNRMPVILDPADYEPWLGTAEDDRQGAVAVAASPAPVSLAHALCRSPRTSTRRNEGPACVEPVGDEGED